MKCNYAGLLRSAETQGMNGTVIGAFGLVCDVKEELFSAGSCFRKGAPSVFVMEVNGWVYPDYSSKLIRAR